MPAAAACLPRGMRWRSMQHADVAAAAALEQRLSEAAWSERNFLDSLAAGHAAWVIVEQGVCIAYAVTARVLDEMELLIIGVAAHKQRQGLGRGIMQSLMQTGRAVGAQCLHLEVRESNQAARALYASCGFVEVGRRRNYYACTPGAGQPGREDALLMTVSL